MKRIAKLGLILVLIGLTSSCTVFRKQNPFNVQCPQCGYQWDYTYPRD